jgi:hypothetical protein
LSVACFVLDGASIVIVPGIRSLKTGEPGAQIMGARVGRKRRD